MRRLVIIFPVFVFAVVGCWDSVALAALPTQQDVFKSIQDNVGESSDPKKFIAVICAIIGVAVLMTVLSNRTKRKVTPKVLNHQGKLLKEVMKTVDLRPVEIKQLKMLADDQNVSSPLTLLLCPSVLAKAVKAKSGKIDRKVIMGVARKLG